MRAHRRTNTENRASRDHAFSRGVLERDGRKCRMQMWVGRFNGEALHNGWIEHGTRGNPDNPIDPAHIYPRNHCGDFWDDPIVGLAACRNCHDRLDGSLRDKVVVRVPPDREKAAFDFLMGKHKKGELVVKPVRRKPPTRPIAA